MSLVEHDIFLDLKTPRSVEPVQLFSDDLSGYTIYVTVTEDGKKKSMSLFSTFKLVIEGFEEADFPSGTCLPDGRIMFPLDGVTIQDGWSVCSVKLTSGSTVIETQVFQIYKHVNYPIQVDETPFLTLTQEQLIELVNLANGLHGADAAALCRLKNTESFDPSDTDKYTCLNVDNLQLITYDEIVKLAGMALISSVTDDATHSATGSEIVNGVLHINPKIHDVKVNNNSVVTDGLAAITASSVIPEIRLRDNKTLAGNQISVCDIRNNGSYDIKITTPFLETVKYNGNALNLILAQDKYAVEIDAVAGVTVGATTLAGGASHPYIELEAGNGISLSASSSLNKVTIGFDATSGTITVPVANIDVPSGASNGDVLIVNNGALTTMNLADSLDISRTGGDVNIVTTYDQSFDFDDFVEITEPEGTDLQPFLRFEIDDVDGEYYLINGEYTKEAPSGTYTGHMYSQVGKKISWGNLMDTFKETHRNEYFTKTIPGLGWGSSQTYSLTITAQDLAEHNLTAEQVIDEQDVYHTHAHVHPEPDSLYDYANYGIYCTGAQASSGDVVFTFARNSQITTMPNVAVTIEVRIG